MSYRLSRMDKWLLGSIVGLALALVTVISLLAPASGDNDPRPTTYNAGEHGAKAAYLLLQAMGVPTERWERPLTELSPAEAAHTTLILADPNFSDKQADELKREVHGFLEHGGRVIATGASGAQLLGGKTAFVGKIQEGLCLSTPEGPGELAAAGSVQFDAMVRWAQTGVTYRVEQRCGVDPVVVTFTTAGGGEAIWWAAATPLTNGGLKDDANLRFVLASLGPGLGAKAGAGRRVLFDESLRTMRESLWDYASGLPLTWLSLQAALLGGLLIFSFSRRRGPIRPPRLVPRSSPLEFAESMGDLYEKAGAQIAAIGAAQRRLDRLLLREAGLQQATLEDGPRAIAEALTTRLGGDWSALAQHLEEAAETRNKTMTTRTTLHLVRALHGDEVQLRERLRPAVRTKPAEENNTASVASSA